MSVLLCVWLLLLNMISVRFISFAVCTMFFLFYCCIVFLYKYITLLKSIFFFIFPANELDFWEIKNKSQYQLMDRISHRCGVEALLYHLLAQCYLFSSL